MNLKDTPSATSLQVSEDGHTPCSLQDGQQTDLFGQVLAPASHSVPQESKKAKTMNGICGQCGSSLSVNPNRQLCLENKCQPQYAMVGGMMWPTPRGRKLGQLVVSAHPISGTDNTKGIYVQGCKDEQGQRQSGGSGAWDYNVAHSEINRWSQGNTDATRCGEGICTEQRAMLIDNSEGNVANASGSRLEGYGKPDDQPIQEGWEGAQQYPWEGGVWIDCPDGKQRLIEPSIPLLAHGVSARVAQLRGLGNAIVPQVAEALMREMARTLNESSSATPN